MGEVADVEEPEVERFSSNGKAGLRYKNTSKIIVPATYYNIWSISDKNQYFVAKVSKQGKFSDSYYQNDLILMNSSGNILIDKPFHNARHQTEKYTKMWERTTQIYNYPSPGGDLMIVRISNIHKEPQYYEGRVLDNWRCTTSVEIFDTSLNLLESLVTSPDTSTPSLSDRRLN